MGTAGSRRTASPEGQDGSASRQSQVPQIIGTLNITPRFDHLGQNPSVLNLSMSHATPGGLPVGRARPFWRATHCYFKGLALFAGHPGKSFLTSRHEQEQISFSSADGG